MGAVDFGDYQDLAQNFGKTASLSAGSVDPTGATSARTTAVDPMLQASPTDSIPTDPVGDILDGLIIVDALDKRQIILRSTASER